MHHRHIKGTIWTVDEPPSTWVDPAVTSGGAESVGKAFVVEFAGAETLAAIGVAGRLECEPGKDRRLVKPVNARLVIADQGATPSSAGSHGPPQKRGGVKARVAPAAGHENGRAVISLPRKVARKASWQDD